MMKLHNPILPGFHADPCICRRGGDYYLVVSSFEWMPGLPVYHSRDLRHWALHAHILTDDLSPNLRGLPSAKGIWAPCLTWCEADGLFYCVYGVMNSMNARFFDVNNYLITAPDIRGPWSDPVYLHSAGFDASMLHDDDGRKWVVSLEWETREGYEHPGAIVLCEYLPKEKRIDPHFHRIWRGGTDRGCLEGPHLTRRNGLYYLMCAEGGTGYGHCVTMARAKSVYGPYEGDPENPIVTAHPEPFNLRGNPDHLRPQLFNPESALQKCGHGSYVDLPNGEACLFHLCARPMLPALRCVLGRETAMQRMTWTSDGWLRMADGGRLARAEVEAPDLPSAPPEAEDDPLSGWYAPRIHPRRFAEIHGDAITLRGQESLASTNEASLLARKLTGLHEAYSVRMRFDPIAFQHSAGIVLYYDNMNWLMLRKYFSETLAAPAIGLLHVENGVKREYPECRAPAPEGEVALKIEINGPETRLYWGAGGAWNAIGGAFPTDHFSDEYSEYGEFTGAFVGLACVDGLTHSATAVFSRFAHEAQA